MLVGKKEEANGSEEHKTQTKNEGEKKTGKRNGKKSEQYKVNKLVTLKLEKYMNEEKRERQFDPLGYSRTNSRMHKYDLMYRVIEYTTLEKQARQRRKNESKSSNGGKGRGYPSPVLIKNSRRITLESESLRITQNAATVMDEVPVRVLAEFHGCESRPVRLKRKDQITSCYLPPVQGYSNHVGSILHGKKYMDYYNEHGLKCGTREFKERLSELKKQVGHSSASNVESNWTGQETGSSRSYSSFESGSNSPEDSEVDDKGLKSEHSDCEINNKDQVQKDDRNFKDEKLKPKKKQEDEEDAPTSKGLRLSDPVDMDDEGRAGNESNSTRKSSTTPSRSSASSPGSPDETSHPHESKTTEIEKLMKENMSIKKVELEQKRHSVTEYEVDGKKESEKTEEKDGDHDNDSDFDYDSDFDALSLEEFDVVNMK